MALAVTKETKTARQVLEALAFEVRKEDAFTKDGKKIPGKVVVRQDNRAPLSWVGDSYGLVPHGDLINPVLKELKDDFELKQTIVERDGRRISVQLLSNADASIVSGDKLRLKVELINSLDRTQSLKAVVGAFRLSCLNGSGIFIGGATLNIKEAHTKKIADTLADGRFRDMFSGLVGKFKEAVKHISPLTSKQLKDDEAAKIIGEYVGKKSVDEIMGLWTKGRGQSGEKTAWGLFNGASQYLTDAEGNALLPISASLRTVRKTTELLQALKNLN